MPKRSARGLLYGPRDTHSTPKLPAKPVKEQDLSDFLDEVENYSTKVEQYAKWFDYGFLDDPQLRWVELIWNEDGAREALVIDGAIREIEPEVTEWRIDGEYQLGVSDSGRGWFEFEAEGHTLRELLEIYKDSRLLNLLVRLKPFEAPWVAKS